MLQPERAEGVEMRGGKPAVWIAVGVAVGVAIGTATHALAWWICIGVVVGAGIGTVLGRLDRPRP